MFFQSLFGFGLLISVFFNGSFSWACSNAVCIGDSVIYPASDKKAQIDCFTCLYKTSRFGEWWKKLS